MPPRSAVHFSKKEAILQLCNFLCASSVSNITELADGQILIKTIQNKFPKFYIHPPENCVEEIKSSNDDMDIVQSKEESNDTSEKLNDTSYPAKEDNENILLQFNYIQKFIDDCYKIKSSEIISYTECTKLSELEITKVAVFVLSEIVKELLEMNNEHLQTLFHLDVKYQVELEDCFKILISERDKISKEVVEKLLSKSARKSSPFITPRRSSSRHKEQKFVSPITPKEDIFTNSPLKVYFESPIFKKEDILMKEKQIENLKKILDEEDEESSKLQRKLSEMEKELKKKDKNYKRLEKQVAELNKEIQVLQNSCQSESCKIEKEKLLTEYNMSKSNAAYLTDRIVELTNQIAELNKVIEEKESLEEVNRIECSKSLCVFQGSSTPNSSPKKTEKLQLEIGYLKERIKCLELKIFSYKKQLSERVLAELKEKKTSGNLNQSYEEIWEELDKERKEEGENLAKFIEEDNRILRVKLNEEILKNKKLLEEMQIFKESATDGNKKETQQELVSNGTMTDEYFLPTVVEFSETLEIRKLQHLINQSKNAQRCLLPDEPSYSLNNSDNSMPCEQSLLSSESEVKPFPEKSSEAVLWKTYESQKNETGTSYGPNLHGSSVSETSNLGVKNDLEMCKIRNAESDMLPSQANEYVLGNLNFDAFLNELKKLTKNGSFQKVLQVFGKRQKEINGTIRYNKLDLQELLKMITECVCTAVTLNAESSFTNRQDKCCSTNENELYIFNQDTEQLKNKLTATCEEMQKCKNTVEELNQKYHLLELENQTINQKFMQKMKAFEEVVRKYQDLSVKCNANERRLVESKEQYKRLLDINKKQYNDNLEIKRRAYYLYKKRNQCENVNKLLKQQKLQTTLEKDSLKEELKNLKEEFKKLKEEKEKAPKEKEVHQEKESASGAGSSELHPAKDSCLGFPNHLGIKSELHSSFFQDTANESVLSGAFHKSISHYISENEEDFCYYNSLDVIKKGYDEERIEELKRRNSVLPLHLQSAYPIEGDLHTSYESLYVKDDEKYKEKNGCKKRKCEDPILEDDPSSNNPFQFHTPRIAAKQKKKLKTPNSIKRFIQVVQYRRPFPKKS